MTRIEEAKLAFVGNGEVARRRLVASNFEGDAGIKNLLAEGMIEQEGADLIVTIKGWRHLDARPVEE